VLEKRKMMTIDIVNTNKLYKAYSFVDNHPDLGNVCFAWFYHLREKPVAPYQDLIEGYGELDESLKDRARRDADELFTDQEVQTMPIRLTQNGALGYDPVHVRLPSASVGGSASFP